MKIVITVNKRDVWFCRICVASIRYYYPEISIFLLKDEQNGAFSTNDIEQYWNVDLIEFEVKKFGWSAAKMHLYTDPRFAGKKLFVLDADIIMVGKLLDAPFLLEGNEDVIVSADEEDVYATWFKDVYYDINDIKKLDDSFEYPGYVFNCGQLFCKGNFLTVQQLKPYFNFNGSPSWKDVKTFPMVDQSVLNYLLPTLETQGKLSIGKAKFMVWSEMEQVKQIQLKDVKLGEAYPFVIHYAGALRTPLLHLMSRGDILHFFENFYYSKIPMGFARRLLHRVGPFIYYYFRNIYNKTKDVCSIIFLGKTFVNLNSKNRTDKK